jgi:amino acid adenylation domain-containing protein
VNLDNLIKSVEARGIDLWFEGERLRFRAPQGSFDGNLRSEISKYRSEVVARLRDNATSKVEDLPLSYSQRSLWFLHQQAPKSTAYHEAMCVRVRSQVDTTALNQAFQAIVDRHEVLRSVYVVDDDLRRRVFGAVDVAFESYDAHGLGEKELRKQVEADFHRPFDLEAGPVIRMSLHSRAMEDHVLLLAVHHIAADAWSLLIVFREFIDLYAEACGGPAVSLPAAGARFADYVSWQSEVLQTADGDRLWSYWRNKLAALPAPLALATDRPRPKSKSFRGASSKVTFEPGFATRLRQVARQEETTIFVVLLATFQVLLSGLGNVDDVIVGTPTFARSKPEFLPVVGDFVNSVALRGRLRPEMTFVELVSQLRATVIEALDAQEFPFMLLVEKLQPERDPARSPLFDTFFSILQFDDFRDLEALLVGDESDPGIEFGGIVLSPYPFSQQEGQFDLALQLAERNDRVFGILKYSTDLFDQRTASYIAAQYGRLVKDLMENPGASIARARSALATKSVAELDIFLKRLRDRDVRLKLDGDKLNVSAPQGVIDESLRSELAARKDEIKAHLGKAGCELTDRSKELIPILSRKHDLPLSHSQQRLWFIRQMDPGSHVYNVPSAIRIKGKLDTEALRRTLHDLIERHESLRTEFFAIDGTPRSRITPQAPVTLEWVDLAHLRQNEREASAMRAALEIGERTFDLSRAPLLCTLLIQMAADEHIFVSVFDHIVTDGLSLGIFLADFRALYAKHIGADAEALPDLTTQFVDYVEWERRSFERGAYNGHVAYWKAQLTGSPSLLQLPTDRPRPPIQTSNGARVLAQMPAALGPRLKALARKENATLFMVLMAAFQVLLHRYTGETDIAVGTAIANRKRPEVGRVIGFFANNIVLRADLSGNPTMRDFIARVRDLALNAYAHQEMPFDVLVDELASRRELDHSPLFQVMLVLQDIGFTTFEMSGLACEAIELPLRTARLDLAVDVLDLPGGLNVYFEYNTDLFDAATMERMQAHFERLLEDIVDRPEARIGELTMLSGAERDGLLLDFNRTGVPFPGEQTMHGLFEAQVARTPEATAVLFEDKGVTYRELNKRANQLAHYLRAIGVGRGSLVGVWMERSAEMVVALLGVLKAGGAYVPLDPAFPKERIDFMTTDADLKVVVTESRLARMLSAGGLRAVRLDADAAELALHSGGDPESTTSSRDLAYVIYTSGSTGRPKGVMLEHRSVVNFLQSMQVEPGIAASDRFVAVTTLSFDIAVLEIFGPLTVGGTVVIAPRATALDGVRLAELLEDTGATLLQATPATWRLLIDSGWRGRGDLKMLCGGEALPRDLADKLLGLGGGLWNMYGPTETTVWSTLSRVTDTTGAISIGRPIANTQVYILEASNQAAPIGVAGELCVAGAGLARGYLNRDELTAEKFVTLDLATIGATRVYRTGDMVRFLADGSLEFVGRRDQQVKVRGFRIELGEIESVLATHPGVKEGVVVVHEESPGDQRVVAYVVPEADRAFDADAARATLRAQLPEYMIPNIFVVLDSLPLTPNGKVDRRALPSPMLTVTEARSATEVTVMTPVQRQVADLWQSILKLDRVTLHENFFDLGGHSLLLVRLHAALQREFDCQLQLVELFQRTTVATQAERVVAVPRSSDGALKRAQARAAKQAQLHG